MKPVLLALLLCAAGSVCADIVLPGGIQPYTGSSLFKSSEQDQADYELVLGTLTNVNGRLEPKRAERIRGRLQRYTWRVPDGRDPAKVFGFMVDQVDAAAGGMLFLCQGRNCGSSNDWANHVFGVAQLYGPDDDQYYLAARFGGSTDAQFAAIYVVRRGNKRLYMHVDVLHAASAEAASIGASPGTLLELLKKHRRLELSQFQFGEQQTVPQVSTEAIDLLVTALNRELSIDAAVVAHVSSGQGIVRDLELSRSRARAVTDLLVKHGVARKRLYPFGAGSLVPPLQASGSRDRVELVLP